MALTDWFKGRAKAAPVDFIANRQALLSLLSDLHPSFKIEDLTDNPDTLLDSAYSNPTVSASVDLIATAGSCVTPRVIYVSNKRLEKMIEPVFETFEQKMYSILAQHLLFGLSAVHTPSALTVDSVVLPAAQLETDLDNTAKLVALIVQGSTKGPRRIQGSLLNEIFLFINTGARGDPYKAQPVASRISDAVVVNSACFTFYKTYLQNGATFGSVLQPKDGKNLEEGQAAAMEAELKKRGGAQNALSSLILESGNLEYVQLGGNAKDAMVINLLNDTTLQIASAFGVPATMLNAKGAQTYSNPKEAKVALYMNTVLPLLNRFYSGFSYHLSKVLTNMTGKESKVVIGVEEKDVQVLKEYRINRAQKYGNVPIMKVNEAREELGLPPLTGDQAELGNKLIAELAGATKNPSPPEANPQPVSNPTSDDE